LLFSLQQVPDVTWQANACGCEPGFVHRQPVLLDVVGEARGMVQAEQGEVR
jgi:hypothetical protein